MKGCKCSKLEAGRWFLENDILSSGFEVKSSHCKLVRDFSTFLVYKCGGGVEPGTTWLKSS